jgi:hypothetical protein
MLQAWYCCKIVKTNELTCKIVQDKELGCVSASAGGILAARRGRGDAGKAPEDYCAVTVRKNLQRFVPQKWRLRNCE